MNLKDREFSIFYIFVFFLLIVVISLLLYSVCDWKKYRADANNLEEKVNYEVQEKGNFYDRNGRPLTQNVDVCWVYFNSKKEVFVRYDLPKNQCPLTRKLAVDLLAKTIDKDPNELYKQIYESGKKLGYICVAQNLPIKYLDAVNKLNYQGINAERRTMRFYPEGALASRIIGATKSDGEPLEGLELSMSKYTQGRRGEYTCQKDKNGRAIIDTKIYQRDKKTGEKLTRVDGSNVFLTIDTNIQFYAEKALNDMASVYKPQCAMCVVMDPKTSEILAMANYPKFDPNNRNKYSAGMSKNFAVQNMYEPGSTLKAFTVSMGVNEGYGADYAFGTCTNVIGFGHGVTVKCDHGPHGACTPRNIIAKSCNIGAWYVTKKIGKQKLYDYFKNFGILGRPGREFGYEAVGYILNKPEKWMPVDTCNYSFGQGMLTSCLAMCNGYCCIANGGVYHTPKIIKEVKDLSGDVKQAEAVDEGRRVISEEAAKVMWDMLKGCVNNGTGKPAKLSQWQAAGKTGSAQMFVNGTYKSGAYLASFMGFAPAEKPELVCAVMVERPQGSSYGATVAAPVWQKTMEKSMQYIKTNSSY